jgi:hypothetical protein
LTRAQFLAAVNRTIGYSAAGYICGLIAHQQDRALSFGLEVGFAIGAVTATTMTCTPFVEWMADNMPARRMGVVGVALILVGFALQSVQYWMTLLDVSVR